MFESTLLESTADRSPTFTSRHRIIATLAATMLEVFALGALVLVPLVRTQALDLKGLRRETRVLPPPPRAVQIISAEHERSARPAPSLMRDETLTIPDKIPDTIAPIIDEAPPQVVPDVGVIGGDPSMVGVPGSVLRDILANSARHSPPPPVEPATKGPRRIVQGGNVVAAQLNYRRQPDYPGLAKVARVQGTVRLEAIIGTDGRIQNLQIISGHPMLVKAALEAVAE